METKLKLTGTNVYFLGFCCLFISEIVLASTRLSDIIPSNIIQLFELLLKGVGLLLLFIKLFRFQSISRKKALVYLVVLAITLLGLWMNRATAFPITVLLLLAAEDIDFEEFGKKACILILVTVLFISALALSGVISMRIKERKNTDILRYSLGFTHPNVLSMLVFTLIGFYLYLKGSDHRYWKYIPCFIVGFVLYKITNSITFFLLLVMLLVCSFYITWISRSRSLWEKRNTKKLIWMTVILGCILAGVVITYFYLNTEILVNGLKTLGTRFKLAKKYIEAYGIQPFGSQIAVGKEVEIPGFELGYYYLDSGVFRLPVQFGWIPTLMIVTVFVIYIKTLIQKEKWQMLVIAACCLVYFFTEQKMIQPYCNLFVLHIGTTLCNLYKKERAYKTVQVEAKG